MSEPAVIHETCLLERSHACPQQPNVVPCERAGEEQLTRDRPCGAAGCGRHATLLFGSAREFFRRQMDETPYRYQTRYDDPIPHRRLVSSSELGAGGRRLSVPLSAIAFILHDGDPCFPGPSGARGWTSTWAPTRRRCERAASPKSLTGWRLTGAWHRHPSRG